ncbi:hypothetical protein C8Q76DRAFT_616644 [Earliella scabrosa]|nr:hypothetical protein C8Q76DRAFT_616644 [Earliella scabrosa]
MGTDAKSLSAAEPVFRWDTGHPADVFESGFQPATSITDEHAGTSSYSLENHVDPRKSSSSVFVATVQCFQLRVGPGTGVRRLVRWRPKSEQGETVFEYEIFAHGGIDVNATLGKHHNKQRHTQHQVAFPGGIRTQFIRGAREWKGGRLVRIWDNPRFDNTANGRERSPSFEELPAPIRPTKKERGRVDVIFFPSRGPREATLSSRAVMDGSGDDPDEPYPEGDSESGSPGPQIAITHRRGHPSTASFLDPLKPGRAYMFRGNRFVPVRHPEPESRPNWDTFPESATILNNWPSLVEIGLGNLDAVLPDAAGKGVLHVFWSDVCATIRLDGSQSRDDRMVKGSATIASTWPSLAKAGFDTVDAVLPIMSSGRRAGVEAREAYVFSGEHFLQLMPFGDPSPNALCAGSKHDVLLDSPKPIADGWPSLKEAGFRHVDTALLDPDNPKQAYFFCGTNYVLVDARPGELPTSPSVRLQPASPLTRRESRYQSHPDSGPRQGRLAILGESRLLVKGQRPVPVICIP